MAAQELARERRKAVVIGGGVAGALVANSLQFHADVTLVDPKEYFEIPWASLRAMVEPSFGERSVINHRDYLSNGRIITSSAIHITDSEVLTANGCWISYNYLVIATGHNTDPIPKTRTQRLNQHQADAIPETRTQRLNQYQAEYEKIRSARSILIVGGGPTGVELAAEIAVDFSDKEVTLVHNGSRLLEFIGPKSAKKALKWLKSKHVEVKLQQSVILNPISDGTYRTSDGEPIKADCCFLCTGRPLGSQWLRETFLKNNIDNQGRLMVDKNLRVKGHKNIFALGDITDIPEIKLGRLAKKHALMAAENLKLLMMGGKESKMKSYKPRSTKAIVSLGRNDAVAQLAFTTVIGSFPGIFKSRDLFVGKVRKQLGLHPDIEDD